MAAYRVFHLEAPELRSRGGGAALVRLELAEQHTGDLQRLAELSNKDAATVAAQCLVHYPVAMETQGRSPMRQW